MNSHRLVIKIGSSLLVDHRKGKIRREWLLSLGSEIATLKKNGMSVIIVSSGAIAVGRTQLGLDSSELKLEQKQAAAAVGQILITQAWQDSLKEHNITVAQILLTLSDTEERRRHLNARATIETLFDLNVVPVINENDTIATEEIRFGDNDRLAARVAQMTSADTLVLMSDVDGLYTSDPKSNPDSKLLTEVTEITPQINAMAGEARAGYSSGGMVTKLEAAKIAMSAGCSMIITDGKPIGALSNIFSGGRCTWFKSSSEPMTARKKWIAGTVTIAGKIKIDQGATKALFAGKSLLPAGVSTIEGNFKRGDTVEVRDNNDVLIARGLSAYSAIDAKKILGRKSDEIVQILGYRGRDEMIHRDDLVLDPNSSEKPK